MTSITLHQSQNEVASSLAAFGVTQKELKNIALAAAAARAEATPLHPVNSPGIYSYHAGVAAMRALFLQKPGWEKSRPLNMEVVENKEHGITIVFQNVDNACGVQEPKAITGKGEGAKKLMDNPNLYLWDYMEKEELEKQNQSVWFFCVSSNGDDVKAELSLPKSIDGTQFGKFLERIFIVSSDDWDSVDQTTYEENDDFEIIVTKK